MIPRRRLFHRRTRHIPFLDALVISSVKHSRLYYFRFESVRSFVQEQDVRFLDRTKPPTARTGGRFAVRRVRCRLQDRMTMIEIHLPVANPL
jgi:hypothetical protein